MIKKALVISFDRAFLQGIVSILNSLEYYENELDVKFLYMDYGDERAIPPEFIKDVSGAEYPYDIEFIPISKQQEKYPTIHRNPGWYLRFHKFKLYRELADNYDAIGSIDADMIVLDKIDRFWDLAANTKYMLTANQGFMRNGNVEEIKPFLFGSWPLYNLPVICSPKEWKDLFEAVWEIASFYYEDAIEQRSFNHAIAEAKRQQDIIILPEFQWIGEMSFNEKISEAEFNNKKVYRIGSYRFRIYTAHGRWYLESFCQNHIKTNPKSQALKYNADVLYKAHKYFQETGRLKYKEYPK